MMRIHVTYGAPTRKEPKVGDRRIIRGLEHIRVFRRAHDSRGNVIGYDCTGGRQNYDWVPLADAAKHGAAHHWTPQERVLYQGELKGKFRGKCNRTACIEVGHDVRWWNRVTHAYYCTDCRRRINDADEHLGTPSALFDPQPHSEEHK
jgi:hypothetical protein